MALATITTATNAVNAVRQLITLFGSIPSNDENVSRGKQVVNTLKFDLYDEEIDSRILRGIRPEKYRDLIESFASRNSIPSRIKENLLDMRYADEDMRQSIRIFQFERGNGIFLFGIVGVVKSDGKLDMGHSLYKLKFEISPTTIEHREAKKFLGFIKYGTQITEEHQQQNISEEDVDSMEAYFKNRAIIGFMEEAGVQLQHE